MDASSWLNIKIAREKTTSILDVVEHLLRVTTQPTIGAPAVSRTVPNNLAPEIMPAVPGRDVELVLEIKSHPPKAPLNTPEGQARMLHDLGNIELQAMELAVRTLAQFPEAPKEFREELAEVAIEEARHFGLCLDALNELGRPWGSWPVHRSLWDVVTDGDLLERVLIVHRYMEGAGLDAGSRLMDRLTGVVAPLAKSVVGTILREEIGHVAFGSKWFRLICADHKIDSDAYFRAAYPQILAAIPRNEKPDFEIRRKAGFNESEIDVIRTALASTDFTKKRTGGRLSLSEALNAAREKV
jgi:uncharacterized ferritin-like protein (DUF455 family)